MNRVRRRRRIRECGYIVTARWPERATFSLNTSRSGTRIIRQDSWRLQRIHVCDGYDAYNKLKKATSRGCLIPPCRVTRICSPHQLLQRVWNTAPNCSCTADATKKDEQIAKPMPSEERHNARQTQSKPVLNAFLHGLIRWNQQVARILRKRYSMQRTRRNTCIGFLSRGIFRSTTTVLKMRYDRCV